MYRTLILVLSLAALGSFRKAEAQGKGPFDGFKLVDKTSNMVVLRKQLGGGIPLRRAVMRRDLLPGHSHDRFQRVCQIHVS
jgi:hypothetical protein